MRNCALLIALFALLMPASGPVPVDAADGALTRWTGPAGALAYAAPAVTATVLARLPDDQPVRVTPVGVTWGRFALWNAVPAWIALNALQPRPFARPAARYTPTVRHSAGAHAAMPLAAWGRVRVAAYVRATASFSGPQLVLLHTGAALAIDAWATDAAGAAWYHLSAPHAGWVWSDAVTFDAGRPAAPSGLLAPLRGKGMWLTYGVLGSSPASAIVTAARAAGLTHLYVEVARSRRGFYGGPGLATLLPAAHHAGLAVIAWVYPFLDDLPADVAMSLDAARYVAPTGDRPDGLLADVETNMAEGTVRAYGQVLRAALGPDRLMAIATYPPQSDPGRAYPFATAALSWNAIVPMDYWHLSRRAYSADEAYRYVRESISLIRTYTRAGEPVEVLGQMFDRFQSGVNSPSAAEISACARAARDAGAIGVSFFEWNHATAEEWGALTAS